MVTLRRMGDASATTLRILPKPLMPLAARVLIGPALMPFTVDRSPHKQGHYLPGVRIPIRHPDEIARAKPDYVFILPWNLKDEIVEQAVRLGTYPISIIPDQDCCTLFTPRNPVTRGRLAEVQTLEGALPIEEMVDRAVKSAVVEDFDFPVITSVGKTGGVEWEQAE